MRVSELLKLDLTDIALGGKAIARHDGRVVFVDRGLPGDQVVARVTRVKRRHAEARLEAIERPSDLRIPAPCPHVPRCGGCRFQDLAYDRQCELKERQVREALVHIAGLADPEVRPIVPAPEPFHYRNKMEFSFAPGPEGPVLGLHERGAHDRIFPVEVCLLPSPLTVEIVRLTQRLAVEFQWDAYHPVRHTGVVRFLTVRHLPLTDHCAVHLIAAGDEIPGLAAWAAAVAGLSSAVRSITLGLQRGRANVAVSESERLLHGSQTIAERLLGLEFEVSANAFLQTNSRQAEALYACALETARIGPEDTLIDLYCGTGTLTLLAARQAREAIGVESVPDAIARARRNAERNHVANARFVEGEARRVLREWAQGIRPAPIRADLVMVDPPRAGLHPRVVARVAELEPRRIVYVSCNPATLARDLADFAARGFALAEVTPFDMFPHTPHIECVARLEPAAAVASP